MIKKLMWLIKHQEEIEESLKKPKKVEKPKEENNYSIAGVPDFQKQYVEDILSGKLKESK